MGHHFPNGQFVNVKNLKDNFSKAEIVDVDIWKYSVCVLCVVFTRYDEAILLTSRVVERRRERIWCCEDNVGGYL